MNKELGDILARVMGRNDYQVQLHFYEQRKAVAPNGSAL
jgi:hypothetical protein